MPTKKSLDDYYHDGLHDGRAGRPLDLPFSLDLIAGIWDDLGGRINSKFQNQANNAYKRGHKDGKRKR